MTTVTASTPMPALPLIPEIDELDNHEPGLAIRFAEAMFSAAHRFVHGTRTKRDFASAYVQAITHYLQTFASCDFFGILDIEVKAGRPESAEERARCVRSRRAARKRLDMLGASLPESVHKSLVSFAVLGGRCGRLAAYADPCSHHAPQRGGGSHQAAARRVRASVAWRGMAALDQQTNNASIYKVRALIIEELTLSAYEIDMADHYSLLPMGGV